MLRCLPIARTCASRWPRLSALGEPVRVLLDKRPGKATQKRWAWVKKGVPLILEIGGRDAAGGQVSVLRRDRLWNDAAKANFAAMAKDEFVGCAVAELEDIQSSLHGEATARRDANIAPNGLVSRNLPPTLPKTSAIRAGPKSNGRALPAMNWRR